jgi:hypothetical protein
MDGTKECRCIPKAPAKAGAFVLVIRRQSLYANFAMATFIERASSILNTAAELSVLEGNADEARILKQAKASLVETGYDNWNGGITYFTLALEVPLKTFSKIGSNREQCEKSILERVNNITRTDSANTITEVIITPVLLEERTDAEVLDEDKKDVVPAFWQRNYFRLFISHSSKVKKGAHGLKEALAPFQIAAFVAHEDIEASLEWQTEIETALRTMDALVAVITPEFPLSKWCDQEVGFALGKGKFVLPLTTQQTPYGFLAKIQALKIKGLKVPEIAMKISDILIKSPASSPRMTETLVESLVTSGSWETSRRVFKLLETVPGLTASQVARFLSAAEENDQVKKALYGDSTLPERIRALIKKNS